MGAALATGACKRFRSERLPRADSTRRATTARSDAGRSNNGHERQKTVRGSPERADDLLEWSEYNIAI